MCRCLPALYGKRFEDVDHSRERYGKCTGRISSRKQGIHVIAGTGSIGLGFDKDSYYVRSGGWHHLFGGDEGSGYWIGCQLIRHFTMQADGREEKTMMFDYILEKYGLACPEEILRLVINEWKGERDKIASMSKDAYELAEQGDSAAAGIFKSAARELAKIVKGVYRNGNFDIPVYVSYSGGVFKAMKYIKETLEEELRDVSCVFTEPCLLPSQAGLYWRAELRETK